MPQVIEQSLFLFPSCIIHLRLDFTPGARPTNDIALVHLSGPLRSSGSFAAPPIGFWVGPLALSDTGPFLVAFEAYSFLDHSESDASVVSRELRHAYVRASSLRFQLGSPFCNRAHDA